ncbi:hypothetical protein PX554_06445 [Sphingomonas sp. H39-1-10]|uniref:hypothetical protein n=1 Tax=Sphingomonas pollutisoli TaxID=3030829 RepID=UPI0023B979C2|nr:hypothetical protein [Sphingomonas pollutisoli]MDF0487763.1 hypothetical protein [Sphingomonas pollutisoli]
MIIKLGAMAAVAVVGLSTALFYGSGPDPKKPNEAQTAMSAEPQDQNPTMLPARLLDCSLGRIANFDPSKDQQLSEYQFDEHHAFKLYLPSIPTRTKEPPAATAVPEPVDPRTKIVADPDGIAKEAQGRPFDRVIDYWPERVEMTTPINDVAVNLIIVDRIDPINGKAIMFVTKANDAVTFDQKHLYIGQCKVTIGDGATASAVGDGQRIRG